MSLKILKIGHRGAKGYAPENTLASFKKALDLGVDMVEFDIHACQTGQLVVIHDRRVDRVANGQGYVADIPLAELKKLRIKDNQSIPTVEEVLDLIDHQAKVNIEIKAVGIAKAVVNLIEKYVKEKGWAYEDFLVSSFNFYELREVGRLNPKIRIGALTSNVFLDLAKFAEDLGVYSIHPEIDYITHELVDDAHQRGIKVFVFGVNHPEDVEKMKEMGVDGMFSDFPDRI